MKTINSNEEMQQIIKTKNVIIDFSADWCGPCKMFAPIYEKASNSVNEVLWLKVNIEDYNGANVREVFNFQSIPTLIYFKNGKEYKRHTGVMNQRSLIEWAKN